MQETLKSLIDVFEPSRQIVIARELTKLFEETYRCRLSDTAKWMAEDANRRKGEFVLLIEGAQTQMDKTDTEAKRILSILLDQRHPVQPPPLPQNYGNQKKQAV